MLYEERRHEFARERLDGPHHARGVDAPHALLPRRCPDGPVVGHREVAHGRPMESASEPGTVRNPLPSK